MRMFFLLLLLLVGMSLHAQDAPEGVVKKMATTLNMRDAPSPVGHVVAELTSGTPLDIIGRTVDNNWLKVQISDGRAGWVASGYVEVAIDLNTIPITTDNPGTSSAPTPAAPETVPAEAPSNGIATDAQTTAVSLNLRANPTTFGAVIMELPRGTALTIAGRTNNKTWLKVRTADGSEGWVFASYVRVNIDLNGVPVTDAPATTTVTTGPARTTGAVSNINSNARAIFLRGKALGNRANVFSKVGDSITVTEQVFDPIGRGVYNLGDYAYLQGVINFFLTETARNQNSFANTSLAARGGWTTAVVLDPAYADPSVCTPGETPLACEYRTTKPSVALIMFGSNDVHFLDAGTYRANLERITSISIEMGVIPVLSTIPVRLGYESQVNEFNTIVRDVARVYNVPLWDYYGATVGLPNAGLSGDGLHPSVSPRGYEGAADFTGDNLNYGYVVRNLTALQVLDALWRNVLSK